MIPPATADNALYAADSCGTAAAPEVGNTKDATAPPAHGVGVGRARPGLVVVDKAGNAFAAMSSSDTSNNRHAGGARLRGQPRSRAARRAVGGHLALHHRRLRREPRGRHAAPPRSRACIVAFQAVDHLPTPRSDVVAQRFTATASGVARSMGTPATLLARSRRPDRRGARADHRRPGPAVGRRCARQHRHEHHLRGARPHEVVRDSARRRTRRRRRGLRPASPACSGAVPIFFRRGTWHPSGVKDVPGASMTNLDPAADKAVRDAVDAYMEGRLTPEFVGETVFETKNSRYRLLDGVVFAAPDDSLIGSELVGWLMESRRRSVVESAWQPGLRAVLVDRHHGRHIIVTSTTRLLHLEQHSSADPPSRSPGTSPSARRRCRRSHHDTPRSTRRRRCPCRPPCARRPCPLRLRRKHRMRPSSRRSGQRPSTCRPA